MDQLAVAIAPVEETGYGAPALGLYASAVVNGQELAEVLDIDVFFEALTGNGPLPLFTCICGVFGCGDYYIGVAHGVDARIWRNRYAPNPAHVIEVGELRFAWPEVRTVATDLLAMLHTLQREKPGVRLMAASTYATASTIMRSKYRPFRRLSSECSLNHRDCGRAGTGFIGRRAEDLEREAVGIVEAAMLHVALIGQIPCPANAFARQVVAGRMRAVHSVGGVPDSRCFVALAQNQRRRAVVLQPRLPGRA